MAVAGISNEAATTAGAKRMPRRSTPGVNAASATSRRSKGPYPFPFRISLYR
jgi:hypothetical protein